LGGSEMQTFPISGKGNITFNTSTLENGTYVYVIIANDETIARQKMIVQR